MKSAIRNSQSAIALSLVAAVAVLVAAWLLPLPRLVLSDEEDAAKRMPQTQADVEKARAAFDNAEHAYHLFVTQNDVGAALSNYEAALATFRSDTANIGARNELWKRGEPLHDYLISLMTYKSMGDAYFNQLAHYDSELMSWTRSLGTNSEVLRPDTWPIVEYLKLYPTPTGLKTEYATFAADDLQGMVDQLSNPTPNAEPETYTGLLNDVKEAGRSIEYSEGLNAGYGTLLDNYHTKLASVASGTSASSISGGRTLIAVAGNTVLALIIVAGLAALFFSRKSAPNEVAS